MRIYIIVILFLSLTNFFCRPTRNISRVIHKNDTAQTTCFNADSTKSLDSLKVIEGEFSRWSGTVVPWQRVSTWISIQSSSNRRFKVCSFCFVISSFSRAIGPTECYRTFDSHQVTRDSAIAKKPR